MYFLNLLNLGKLDSREDTSRNDMLLKEVEIWLHEAVSGNALHGLFWELLFSWEIKFVVTLGLIALCIQLLPSFLQPEKWMEGVCVFALFAERPLSWGFTNTLCHGNEVGLQLHCERVAGKGTDDGDEEAIGWHLSRAYCRSSTVLNMLAVFLPFND